MTRTRAARRPLRLSPGVPRARAARREEPSRRSVRQAPSGRAPEGRPSRRSVRRGASSTRSWRLAGRCPCGSRVVSCGRMRPTPSASGAFSASRFRTGPEAWPRMPEPRESDAPRALAARWPNSSCAGRARAAQSPRRGSRSASEWARGSWRRRWRNCGRGTRFCASVTRRRTRWIRRTRLTPSGWRRSSSAVCAVVHSMPPARPSDQCPVMPFSVSCWNGRGW